MSLARCIGRVGRLRRANQEWYPFCLDRQEYGSVLLSTESSTLARLTLQSLDSTADGGPEAGRGPEVTSAR